MKSNLKQQFDNDVYEFQSIVETFLLTWYGEKCPDYEETCPICVAWKNFEELIYNPFDESDG